MLKLSDIKSMTISQLVEIIDIPMDDIGAIEAAMTVDGKTADAAQIELTQKSILSVFYSLTEVLQDQSAPPCVADLFQFSQNFLTIGPDNEKFMSDLSGRVLESHQLYMSRELRLGNARPSIEDAIKFCNICAANKVASGFDALRTLLSSKAPNGGRPSIGLDHSDKNAGAEELSVGSTPFAAGTLAIFEQLDPRVRTELGLGRSGLKRNALLNAIQSYHLTEVQLLEMVDLKKAGVSPKGVIALRKADVSHPMIVHALSAIYNKLGLENTVLIEELIDRANVDPEVVQAAYKSGNVVPWEIFESFVKHFGFDVTEIEENKENNEAKISAPVDSNKSDVVGTPAEAKVEDAEETDQQIASNAGVLSVEDDRTIDFDDELAAMIAELQTELKGAPVAWLLPNAVKVSKRLGNTRELEPIVSALQLAWNHEGFEVLQSLNEMHASKGTGAEAEEEPKDDDDEDFYADEDEDPDSDKDDDDL